MDFVCSRIIRREELIQYCDKKIEQKAVKKKWDTLAFVVL